MQQRCELLNQRDAVLSKSFLLNDAMVQAESLHQYEDLKEIREGLDLTEELLKAINQRLGNINEYLEGIELMTLIPPAQMMAQRRQRMFKNLCIVLVATVITVLIIF